MKEIAAFFTIVVFVFLPGCSYTGYENVRSKAQPSLKGNERLEEKPVLYRTEKFSWRYIDRKFLKLKRPPPPFVGVAISGGGSRAANFGAAVLQELNDLGILEHVTAISSVSGGSLAAAYYARAQKTNECRTQLKKEAWRDMRRVMKKSFFHEWLWEHIKPTNWFRFAFTDFNRSDLMTEVFDEDLFGEKIFFSNIECPIPRLLINATEITRGGNRRIFSNDIFTEIRSDLFSYPVSHAVMASSAFPGVFRSMTLRNYAPDTTVRVDDIFHAPSLANKLLYGQRNVEQYLRGLVSTRLEPLQQKVDSSDANISKELARILNIIVCRSRDGCAEGSGLERSIFRKKIFEHVALSQQTQDLLKETENPESPLVLNRLLLEDVFPGFIKPLPARYVHLIDGGPADNLGVETLGEAANWYFRHMSSVYETDNSRRRACLFIVIDAFPGMDRKNLTYLSKTRTAMDFFIDMNVLDSTDIMLMEKRREILRRLGLNKHIDKDRDPVTGAGKHNVLNAFRLDQSFNTRWIGKVPFKSAIKRECLTWHISFDRLIDLEYAAEPEEPYPMYDLFGTIPHEKYDELKKIYHRNLGQLWDNLGAFYRKLRGALSAIKTHFYLTGPTNCSEDQIQELLYTAAKVLVRDDRKSLKFIYNFFSTPEHEVKLAEFPSGEYTYAPTNLTYTREGIGCESADAPWGNVPGQEW